MNPLQRLGSALDALWSAFAADEPLFCECRTTSICVDCSLAGPVDATADWSPAGAPPFTAR